MEEAIVNNTQEREDDLLTEQQDIFSYYRRLRSNLFSDTEVVYETKLTPELFDLKLQHLTGGGCLKAVQATRNGR